MDWREFYFSDVIQFFVCSLSYMPNRHGDLSLKIIFDYKWITRLQSTSSFLIAKNLKPSDMQRIVC